MARVSLIIAFSVLAVVAARAYPSSQEKSTKDNANWTSLETVELIAIEEAISDFCDSDETVENVVERGHNINLIQSFQPILACVSYSIPVDIFMAEFITVTNETRSDFFPRYCPQLRTAGPCAQRVVKAVKPCLREEDFTIVSALASGLPEAIELFCINDGEEVFTEDYNPQYKECLNGQPSICNHDLDIERFYPSNLTQDQCGAIDNSAECLLYKANMCGAPYFNSLYDLFFQKLFFATPCSNYATLSDLTEIDNNIISEA